MSMTKSPTETLQEMNGKLTKNEKTMEQVVKDVQELQNTINRLYSKIDEMVISAATVKPTKGNASTNSTEKAASPIHARTIVKTAMSFFLGLNEEDQKNENLVKAKEDFDRRVGPAFRNLCAAVHNSEKYDYPAFDVLFDEWSSKHQRDLAATIAQSNMKSRSGDLESFFTTIHNYYPGITSKTVIDKTLLGRLRDEIIKPENVELLNDFTTLGKFMKSVPTSGSKKNPSNNGAPATPTKKVEVNTDKVFDFNTTSADQFNELFVNDGGLKA